MHAVSLPYNNYLLTESEVMPALSALPNQPRCRSVDSFMPQFDISRHDRTVEVSKLFIIWHF